MCKNETFFILMLGVTILLTPLYGEMSVGIVTSINNNAKINLLYQNTPIMCEPFGILTLEKLPMNAKSSKECQEQINAFYKAHPHDQNYAREHVLIQQSYHYERIKEGCVLYSNGPESYSEVLLREGLALIDPAFDLKEWNGRLKRAQQGAQIHKNGLHDTLIEKACSKEEK